MKKYLRNLLCATLLVTSAGVTLAEPGEYWEVSTKMEMPGMPIAIPAITLKVCVPTGGERNPQYMQKKDDKCQMSDIKTSGNKTSWKVKCVERDGTITGTGESVHERDSWRGVIRMKGAMNGQNIDMTQNHSGKKIGGACDTGTQANEIKKLTGDVCDASKFTASDWIGRADLFLQGSTCPGKKSALCRSVKKDATRDAEVYQMLIDAEQDNDAMITTACGLDLEAMRAAVCRANKGGDYDFLKANCPTEARSHKDASRKYGGEPVVASTRSSAASSGSATQNIADANTNNNNTNAQGIDAGKILDAIPTTGNASTDAVIDSAKKLKGLFGF